MISAPTGRRERADRPEVALHEPVTYSDVLERQGRSSPSSRRSSSRAVWPRPWAASPRSATTRSPGVSTVIAKTRSVTPNKTGTVPTSRPTT
jgi:hypothetical protein